MLLEVIKMVKKALVVGIDNYPGRNKLNTCVNDANCVADLLEFNENKNRNFSIIKLLNENATYKNIEYYLKMVFSDDCEIGLFYFSGHGHDDEKDGRICTIDFENEHFGMRFSDIIDIVQSSKCKNKVIILDCCYSGRLGNFKVIGDQTLLSCGTTILTSCNKNEISVGESAKGTTYSLFTNLLIYALKGGASDIFGRVTPGSIYSFIDSSLGNFDQRPLFKSNVESFVTLREAKEKMSVIDVRNVMGLFPNMNYLFKLDPSYEPQNYLGSKGIGTDDLREPYFDKEHGKIFALLQEAVSNGLVKPSNEKHMFYAALNSDTCELTDLGKHYWWMVDNKII